MFSIMLGTHFGEIFFYNIHFSFNVTLLTPEENSICGLKYRNISEGTENKAIFKKKKHHQTSMKVKCSSLDHVIQQ